MIKKTNLPSKTCTPQQRFDGSRLTLWLLRMLVPLGLHCKFITEAGFSDETLARRLGLIGDDDATDPLEERFDRHRAQKTLRQMHAAAEREASNASLPVHLQENIDKLSHLLSLSTADQDVLGLAIMICNERVLDDAADELGVLNSPATVRVVSVLLDLQEADVRRSLATDGALTRAGLLHVDRLGGSLLRSKLCLMSDLFGDHMLFPQSDALHLLRSLVAQADKPQLSLQDFAHMQTMLDIALPYLQERLDSRSRGVNVLLYGPPGTGKTQLARVLAGELGCELFEVSSEDLDGDPVNGFRRLCAYRAGQSLLSASRALIAFDEVEDVCGLLLNGRDTAGNSKAWFNRMLEENPVPAIWMTNDLSGLDAAFIRRFDLVFEMDVPPRSHRLRIIESLCGHWLDPAEARRLAEIQTLAPAVVARAAAVTEVVNSENPSSCPGKVLGHLIGHTLQALGLDSVGNLAALPGFYDPRFVNADTDLAALGEGVRRAGQARICLYGPPGTGKTAWAHWLASLLDRPLMIERASDLLSMFVGESERNLARCFRKARQEGAVLLIDEVDSMLQERRQVQGHWQHSLVNEMLTQMESFSGVFVATTNLMDQLDQAALRRFDLKLRFDHLRADQARDLFLEHCRELALEALPGDLHQLSYLHQLTPGDFAAAARQARFQPFESATHLVQALAADCSLKACASRAIGFLGA